MFYYLGRNEKGLHTILDTDDNISECYTDNEILKIKNSNMHIKPLHRNDIVLSVNNNEYELSIFKTKDAAYRGRFPTRNNRGLLYEHNIHIRMIRTFKNYILCLVICNCFCIYDIEIPMVMFDIIAFSMDNIKNSFNSIYISKPIYECNSNSDLMFMSNDAPLDSCVPSNKNLLITDNAINVYGVNFSYVPNDCDVFDKIIV